jgi:lipopolysaccharide export LptBFGC system permease protein LptF
MLHNKIYNNYLIEIFRTFFIVLFGLSIIALTVRAVNFLDLIVDNGYEISVYFKYSLLNLFGIAPKFIPLSFLLALSIFIIKHLHESDLIILWTSGVKKIYLVNLFFISSLIILIFYLFLTLFLTPMALNKSRTLLSNDNFSSFLPTIKNQQFSDSFKDFTLIVEKKINNELKNIFLHDKGSNLKSLSSNIAETSSTTIISKSGISDDKKMILFNGQIISTKKNSDTEIIKFEQLNIDLSNLSTSTIKKPKIQETSTLKLFNCLINYESKNDIFCNQDLNKEIISTLNRRVIIPLYIPVLALICSLLLIKTRKKYFNNFFIFSYGFMTILFTELAVRYTGINNIILFIFILLPFLLLVTLYFYLNYKFSRESFAQ